MCGRFTLTWEEWRLVVEALRIIVGDHASIEECLGAWDETESLTLGTAWKAAKAFLLESQYRYSPVSPLYLSVDASRIWRCNARGLSRAMNPSSSYPPNASSSLLIASCGQPA